MMQQLQQQGVSVLNFVLYRRQCPESSVQYFPHMLAKFKADQTVMVLMSSEASWHYWQQLCQQATTRVQWIYVVLGERLYHVLQAATAAQAKSAIIQLNSLSATEMVQRIKDWQGRV